MCMIMIMMNIILFSYLHLMLKQLNHPTC